MSRLALDTSGYSAFRRLHQPISDLLEHADEIFVCAVALGELHAGFGRGNRQDRNRIDLAKFLSRPSVNIGVIDEETARRYGDIKVYLRETGIWIAAHAMQHGLQVVTLDRHFLKMPQVSTLLFEAW